MSRKKTNQPRQRPSPPAAATSPAAQKGWVPFALAAILLAVVVAYSPALMGTAVWDDDANLTRPDLQSPAGLYRIWFEPGATQQYYPLLHTAFWLEHYIWGDAPLGYHLTNVVWHAVSVLLVYIIVSQLDIPGPLLAAAIFAIHPVMVESVAWITEQKNTLSTVFYLGSLLQYLRFDESRQRRFYLVSLLLFLLALLSKSAIVTLPAAVLVILWWKRGTISIRRDAVPLTPFFLAAIVMGLLTCWVEWNRVGAVGAEFAFTPAQRVLLAGRAVWFYIGKLLWPANLIFMYPQWKLDPSQWWQWLYPAAAIAVTIVLWIIRKRSRSPLAGWLFFCGTLLPMLGVLNQYLFRYTFVSDHFQYVASLGLIVPVAAGVTILMRRIPAPYISVARAATVVVLAVLAFLTWRLCPIYADGTTLYHSILARNPDCWLAHNNLGSELAARGDTAGSIAEYQAALKIKPDHANALANLGLALGKTGHRDEAVELYRRALAIDPNCSEAHSGLGVALFENGEMSEGLEHLRANVLLRPTGMLARLDYARALFFTQQIDEAARQYATAVQLEPNSAIAHYDLAVVLLQLGRPNPAREHLETALRLKPDYTDAQNLLTRIKNTPTP